MESLIFVAAAVVVVLFVLVRVGSSSSGGSGGASKGPEADADELQLERALRRHAIRMQSHSRMGSAPKGGGTKYRFTGVDGDGNDVSGTVTLNAAGPATVELAGGAELRKEPGAADEANDPEMEIQREISRRLDAIQGDRAAFLAFDKNGDGKVDADEWAAARAQVEAEVRAAHGGGPTVARLAAPVVLDENSVVEEVHASGPADGDW